ncbi:hypothetical protein BD410DRAFT_747647, partial [Rickenella mellea]
MPEEVLKGMYPAALEMFFAARRRSAHSPHDGHGTTERVDEDADKMRASSAVILLLAAEHHPALSARKRLLLACPSDSSADDLHRELAYTRALLTATHCAKAGPLWYHRRWIIKQLTHLDMRCSDSAGDGVVAIPLTEKEYEVAIELIRTELSIASSACEIYPRNYHAWAHRVICLQALLGSSSSSTDHPPTVQTQLHGLLTTEHTSTQAWLSRHLKDHSAVHYVCWLSRAMNTLETTHVSKPTKEPTPEKRVSEGASVLAKTYTHAESLLTSYPTHETFWLYLRLARSVIATVSSGSVHSTASLRQSVSASQIDSRGTGNDAANDDMVEKIRSAHLTDEKVQRFSVRDEGFRSIFERSTVNSSANDEKRERSPIDAGVVRTIMAGPINEARGVVSNIRVWCV